MQRVRNKRIIVLVIILLLLIVGLLNAPSIVTIEAPSGADIAMSTERGGAFEVIGNTKVTRLFFSKPENLYISANQGNKQSLATVQLQRFKRQTVRLDLINTITAKKISDGSVTNAIFSGSNGQGIVAGQDSLINFSTTSENQPLKPAFAGLPYIRKIIWYDLDNFLYLGNKGVGQFISGNDGGNTNFASTITGKVEVGNTDVSGVPLIRDMAKTAGLPPVFLSTTNIFVGDTYGNRLRTISKFKQADRDTSLFTSGTSIFKVSAPLLTEAEDDDRTPAKPETTIEELSYSGKTIRNLEITDDKEVIGVIKQNGIIYVLTTDDLYTIRGATIQKHNLHFRSPAGITLYKNQLILLADDGLWKITDSGTTFQRLYELGSFGVGLEGSLSVDPNNQLYFGTRSDGDTQSNNAATLLLAL
jgi:hypothetical protein